MDSDIHAKVLRAVDAEGSSISAWLTDAARRALRVREGLAAVAEWEAEHGALTEAELDAARQSVRRRPIQKERTSKKRPNP